MQPNSMISGLSPFREGIVVSRSQKTKLGTVGCDDSFEEEAAGEEEDASEEEEFAAFGPADFGRPGRFFLAAAAEAVEAALAACSAKKRCCWDKRQSDAMVVPTQTAIVKLCRGCSAIALMTFCDNCSSAICLSFVGLLFSSKKLKKHQRNFQVVSRKTWYCRRAGPGIVALCFFYVVRDS